MADTEQVENSFGAIEFVDNSVVAHAQSKRVNTLHPMVRVRGECPTQTVDAGFDSSLKVEREFEEIGVEIARVNLERGCHWPESDWRTRE